jgi:hypothetical protein
MNLSDTGSPPADRPDVGPLATVTLNALPIGCSTVARGSRSTSTASSELREAQDGPGMVHR